MSDPADTIRRTLRGQWAKPESREAALAALDALLAERQQAIDALRRIRDETKHYGGEQIDTGDPAAGLSWVVQPAAHTGHTMTVLGRVFGTSMFIVECECGDHFRMSYATVANARDEIVAAY